MRKRSPLKKHRFFNAFLFVVLYKFETSQGGSDETPFEGTLEQPRLLDTHWVKAMMTGAREAMEA